MHIMEGFLPAKQAAAWTLVATPFIVMGYRALSRIWRERPQARLLLGAAAAFIFVLSALKLPSIGGSCSHPTGTGLGALLFGPSLMAVLGSVVLLFQALLLAHGGITTLGANAMAMAVAGPWAAWGVYRLALQFHWNREIAIFLAAATGNLVTYGVTASQLALAFPDPASGFGGAWLKFMGVFALTQVPLAIMEGLLTVLIIRALASHAFDELDAVLGRAPVVQEVRL